MLVYKLHNCASIVVGFIAIATCLPQLFSNSDLQASVLRQTIVACSAQRVVCGIFVGELQV